MWLPSGVSVAKCWERLLCQTLTWLLNRMWVCVCVSVCLCQSVLSPGSLYLNAVCTKNRNTLKKFPSEEKRRLVFTIATRVGGPAIWYIIRSSLASSLVNFQKVGHLIFHYPKELKWSMQNLLNRSLTHATNFSMLRYKFSRIRIIVGALPLCLPFLVLEEGWVSSVSSGFVTLPAAA